MGVRRVDYATAFVLVTSYLSALARFGREILLSMLSQRQGSSQLAIKHSLKNLRGPILIDDTEPGGRRGESDPLGLLGHITSMLSSPVVGFGSTLNIIF